MRIEINLKIFLAIILFFMFNSINTYLSFMFFILIHEIAHLIVGVIIGGVPQKMTISIFGVSIEFYSYGKNKSLHRIIFFFVGPLINFIIGFLCNKFMKNAELKEIIVMTNYAIAIFNLIPILPLDGGKILKEILKKIFGFEKSNRIMIFISKLFLVIASLIYSILIIEVKNIMILLLLIYLWYLYMIEEKKYALYVKAKKAIENIM